MTGAKSDTSFWGLLSTSFNPNKRVLVICGHFIYVVTVLHAIALLNCVEELLYMRGFLGIM